MSTLEWTVNKRGLGLRKQDKNYWVFGFVDIAGVTIKK